jgi:N-acetylmuramoyl-L-alanine amidase
MLCLGLLAQPCAAQMRPPATVTSSAPAPVADGVDLVTLGDVTRLVFDLTAPVTAQAYVLADPDRVIVDLPEVNFQIDPARGLAPAARAASMRKQGKGVPSAAGALAGSVASYRFGLVAPGKSRVVIDLSGPVRIQRVANDPGAEGRGARLVIELARSDRAGFVAEASRSGSERAAAAQPAPNVAPVGEGALPVVVLDPGHGGIDTGALGASGVLEKDLVFEFAKALAARLEAGKQVRVLMTRDTDVFISLGERVRRARAAGASLFISIHADTLTDDRSVSGATVYTASEKASDAEAARVAEKENQADLAGGLDGREDQSDISDILVDLTRRETRVYSNVFARNLVGYWKDIGLLNKNPHRFAGFRVLRAHDVPSVLLEVGYLSSDRDLAMLSAPAWREKATGVVARAIEGFFRSRGAQDPAQAAAGGDPFGALTPPRATTAPR